MGRASVAIKIGDGQAETPARISPISCGECPSGASSPVPTEETKHLWHELLHDASFYAFLLEADRDLAAQARERGCLRCGGRLDSARYRRKPRGAPVELPAGWDRRESFCCDDCRKRVTPPSLRYLGRRVYAAMVVVLAWVLRQGVTPWRAERLRELVGVHRRTLARWRAWWVERFVQTELWRAKRGRFLPPVAEDELPSSLLERFSGELRERLASMLRFILPVTTTSCPPAWART